MASKSRTIPMNAFQRAVMAIPQEIDLFLGGGRGGGKSYALALLALRHVAEFGDKARILYIRKTYRGLADFESITRELFGEVMRGQARYNQAEHLWRFANGAYMELAQLDSHGDYPKFQGRSFTLLLIDEAGQYDDPALLDLLRSNLRGPKGVPIRTVKAANPGGAGHQWLAQRYVFNGAAPWAVFDCERSKRKWVNAPSTFAGNEFIDIDQYRDQLGAACASDPELLRAWTSGDWSVSRGAYFADVLSEERNAIDPLPEIPDSWETWLSHDFGSSAPSVTYVVAESPGDEVDGRWYPRGSLLLVDEYASVKGEQLNEGLGLSVPALCDRILDMCRRWDIKPIGVGDDSMFAKTGHSSGALAVEFQQCGVRLSPARKGSRIAGWQKLRRLMEAAGKPDRAGLYVSRECRYFWQTVPYLQRDPRRIEDLASDGPDHAADAARYAVTGRPERPGDIRMTYAQAG